MAKVYRFMGKASIEEYIAKLPGVQAELTTHAKAREAKARAILSTHRDKGHSAIVYREDDMDRYIGLSDERGEHAAWLIEGNIHVMAQTFPEIASDGRIGSGG